MRKRGKGSGSGEVKVKSAVAEKAPEIRGRGEADKPVCKRIPGNKRKAATQLEKQRTSPSPENDFNADWGGDDDCLDVDEKLVMSGKRKGVRAEASRGSTNLERTKSNESSYSSSEESNDSAVVETRAAKVILSRTPVVESSGDESYSVTRRRAKRNLGAATTPALVLGHCHRHRHCQRHRHCHRHQQTRHRHEKTAVR